MARGTGQGEEVAQVNWTPWAAAGGWASDQQRRVLTLLRLRRERIRRERTKLALLRIRAEGLVAQGRVPPTTQER